MRTTRAAGIIASVAGAAVALPLSGTAFAQVSLYGWTISASSTDPFATRAPFVTGLNNYYLWLSCSEWTGPGVSAAEFGVAAAPNTVIAFVPASGFSNAGSATDLVLSVSGCPLGPVLAGQLLVVVGQPGSLCIAPSGGGIQSVFTCDPTPVELPFDWFGLDLGAGGCGFGAPCLVLDASMPCCLPDGTCEDRAPIDECPGTWHLYGNKCAGVSCASTAVGVPEPSEAGSWGRVKSRYRRAARRGAGRR